MLLTRPHVTRLVVPVATTAAAAVAIKALADSATEGDGLAGLDPPMTTRAVEHRTAVLTAAARVLTLLGSEAVVSVLALSLVIVLLERRGPRPALVATSALAVSAALTVGVKMAVGRPRPGANDRLGAFDSTYSFPSGHTLNSAVLLGLVCLLLVPLARRRPLRLTAYGTAVLIGIGVGASRIYLGYHWTTDVLASWAIAVVILSVAHVADRLLTVPSLQSGSVQVDRATVES